MKADWILTLISASTGVLSLTVTLFGEAIREWLRHFRRDMGSDDGPRS